ncbi:MAG: hypothetical protein PHR01_01995, partial [Sphaerochaetaceae bacterium]|nr:hypothetical protein [Sphaerochaetaceae bacterium]
MGKLSIPPAKEHEKTISVKPYDFIALGALVTRLDPGIVPFEYADTYIVHVSGGEFNVAANLSRAFGCKTG